MTQVQLIVVQMIGLMMEQVLQQLMFLKFGSDITSDLEFYLSRVDKIFLTREGNIKSC